MKLRTPTRTVLDALGAHAGASVGISGVLMTAGALGIAVGIAETERETRPPPFGDNLWFNLGVFFAVVSVFLAVFVLVSIVSDARFMRRVGRQQLRGRDIRRLCLPTDSDAHYDELKDAVSNWIGETERLLERDPADVAEFTRGGYLDTFIPGASSGRIGALIVEMDGRLERLAVIRRNL